MFSARFIFAFATTPQSSQTYNPCSTRFASRLRSQHEHDFDVLRSETSSTSDAFHLSLVGQQVSEAVERPRIQIEIPVRTPVF